MHVRNKAIGTKPLKRPSYPVTQIGTTDDGTESAPRWKKILRRLSPFFGLIAIITYATYLFELGRCIFTWQLLHNNTLLCSWAFLALQGAGFFRETVSTLWRLAAYKQRIRPKLRLTSDHVPCVDLIVTACGEDDEVIKDTVKAACNIDYPTSKFRVILADDSASPVLKASTNALAERHTNLFYFSRTKQKDVHHGFKAGNLNSAMEYAASLDGGPSEWCAVLDCDMIPTRDLLRALLAHCANVPEIGMAVPPQRFYNIPVNDPLYQTASALGRDDEIIRDAMGATWCTGSGFVFRRTALSDIGGFSETSLAEDVLCSMMLTGRGWQVVYVHEELQSGLVPDNFTTHIKQRTKWQVGSTQNSLRLRFCIPSSPLCRLMTPHQRLAGFIYCVSAWSSTLLRFHILCALPLCLLLNLSQTTNPLIPPTNTHHRNLSRTFFLALLTLRINECTISLAYGYPMFLRKNEGPLWMTPYLTVSILREFLPRRLGGTKMGFTPSGSVKSELNDRYPDVRPGMRKRFVSMLMENGLGYHLAMLCLVVSAFCVSISRSFADAQGGANVWLSLQSNALWPGIGWEQYTSFLTPVIYTIWPPSMPNRRDLMVKDAATGGVWRPREDARGEKWDGWIWSLEIPRAVAFLWALYCAL